MQYTVKAQNISIGRVLYFCGSTITAEKVTSEQLAHLLEIGAIEAVPVAAVEAPKTDKKGKE
jgi:hypothetical protein